MFAIILVMIIIVGALGPRPSAGRSDHPGCFSQWSLILHSIGFTLNIVVLFSLILVAGMLVDGAIVVAEYAERLLAAGRTPRQSFIDAASRMAWQLSPRRRPPLRCFCPCYGGRGWGEFMRVSTRHAVILVLLTALFMALVFMPVTGVLLTRQRACGQWWMSWT